MNVMEWLRFYLVAGMVSHKVVWEVMRRSQDRTRQSQHVCSLRLTLIKAGKVSVFIGILAQTLIPTVLPITDEPTALRIGGAILFTGGLVTAVLGRIQLGRNWSDIETSLALPNHVVISRGLYRYMRHPIYTGDLALLFGLELCLNSWLVLGVAALAAIVLRQVIFEERMLLASLPGYDLYSQRTKRFIPFVV